MVEISRGLFGQPLACPVLDRVKSLKTVSFIKIKLVDKRSNNPEDKHILPPTGTLKNSYKLIPVRQIKPTTWKGNGSYSYFIVVLCQFIVGLCQWG